MLNVSILGLPDEKANRGEPQVGMVYHPIILPTACLKAFTVGQNYRPSVLGLASRRICAGSRSRPEVPVIESIVATINSGDWKKSQGKLWTNLKASGTFCVEFNRTHLSRQIETCMMLGDEGTAESLIVNFIGESSRTLHS